MLILFPYFHSMLVNLSLGTLLQIPLSRCNEKDLNRNESFWDILDLDAIAGQRFTTWKTESVFSTSITSIVNREEESEWVFGIHWCSPYKSLLLIFDIHPNPNLLHPFFPVPCGIKGSGTHLSL